jgi:hypothetical protein
MSLTYTTYVAQITNIMTVTADTPQFQTMLPGMIDYAEQRIYRELDLLQTVVRDSTTQTASGSRNFTLPTTSNGNFITVQGINVITPANTQANSGTRVPLQPVTRDFLDSVYNSNSTTGVPAFFAMIDQFNIILGPWPTTTYYMEVVGTIRPNPLSSSNSSTFLTQYLPDLFVAASMIFASGYQRDFGSQADNPQQSVSWEGQYEKLFASANAEELRKKFAGPGWTSMSSIANPPVR